MNLRRQHTALSVAIAAMMLSACGGGGSQVDPRGINGTYLSVTHQSQTLGENDGQVLYYGTRDVGSNESFAVRIANQGADIYPLTNIQISGEDIDEFFVIGPDEITLQPADVVTVDINFQPISEGPKSATFQLDYDTIQMVDESVNVNEQSYYEADDLVATGQFRAARQTYSEYLNNDPVTVNKQRAAIRLPMIDEAVNFGAEEEMVLYLSAMTQRDEQRFSQALQSLNTFDALYPDSYLADDAMYLQGYIQLLDVQDPRAALRTMRELRERFPDTSYYDTSLFSEAIAQKDLGNDRLAVELLQQLKDRHTAIDTPVIQMPKDNLLSRLWFNRANEALDDELLASTL